MKKKRNVNITIDGDLYRLIDENFDNKSRIVEWCIFQILSQDEKNKEKLKNIEL